METTWVRLPIATAIRDEEHDRFDWVSLEQGMRRCLPEVVAEGLRIVDLEVSDRGASPMRPSAAGR